MAGRRAVGIAVSVCAALAPAGCKEAAPPAAVIRALAGAVTVSDAEGAAGRPASVDLGLHAGNLVTTGNDGTATVEFEGGNKVDLRPDTTLVVKSGGGTTAQFGAVLLAGKATASSSGHGVLLSIGTPFGITELGGAASSLELSLDKGITVLVGEVTVIGSDGARTTVTAGSSLTLKGLEVAIGSEPEGPVVLGPMEFVLLGNPKQVQIKKKGESSWRTPRKRELLGPGDAVRTRKATGTQVQFGDLAEVELGPKAEMRFDDAATGPRAHRARYAVTVGDIIINLKAKDKVGAKHEIDVAGLAMTVEPGLKEAEVEISSTSPDKAQLTVRFGKVALSDGTVVDAGSTVAISKGKVTTPVKPLATTELALKPKSSSVVYFQSEVPPIEFTWKADDGSKGYELELANDKSFATPVFREKIAKNSFVYDRFPPGRYYWRVKGEGEWQNGNLTIQKRKEAECANCKRHNVIDDTGEKTVVYYQKELPAITLRWGPVAGATKYQVKVYPDGEFEKPLVDKVVADTTVAFNEGQFGEGKYYWHMVAQSDGGKDIATGKMNTLQIAYDNAIVDLAIKVPKAGQKVTSKSIVTRGEVQLGASLSINGKRAPLDDNGRFSESVGLDKGDNDIVYRTMSSDGIERYYVRRVVRR